MERLKETEEQIYKKNYISCLNWLSYFKNINDMKNKNSL
jgi:hypothetical protein